jgi:macrolide transport system ATP-binding/permease protein
MAMLNKLRLRLRALFFKSKMEEELDEEVRFHLERECEENIARGMTPEEARSAAIRSFGGVERVKEESRDVWGVRLLEELWQDLRFSMRMLGKQPGFTTVVVLTLALGIGVNTTYFTLFGLFFRPAPAEDRATIVELGGDYSFAGYASFRDHTQAFFSGLIATTEDRELSLGDQASSEESQTIQIKFVSDNFFSLLGAKTALGRAFAPEKNSGPGQSPVVVLSHRCWQSRFGGDPKIIGQTLRLNGVAFVIIGVAAPDFVGVSLDKNVSDAWAPLMMRGEVPAQVSRDWLSSPEIRGLTIAGSLKPGRTLEEASAEVNLLAHRLSLIHPLQRVHVRPCHIVGCNRGSDMWPLISVVMMASAMVLLIACSNIANLMLARGAQRQKEIGVRLCLGASRGRVIRHLLTESLLLACLGGGAGLFLAWWGLHAFLGTAIPLPPWLEANTIIPYLNPDLRVLTYTFLLSLFAGVAFGLAPALRVTRRDLVSTLKDEGASFGQRMARSRLRSALVISQVALSLMLLIGAGLLLRGFIRGRAIDLPIETKYALIVDTDAGLDGYDTARAQLFRQELVARLEALPGVQGVSRAGSGTGTRFTLKDQTQVGHMAVYNEVTPNFFETVGLPIVRGRAFTEEESRARAPVVVVAESTARRLWPNQEPLGQFLRPNPDADFAQVIGVARDDPRMRIGQLDHLLAYIPPDPKQMRFVMVRTSGEARAMKPLARAVVKSLEPHLSLRMWSLEETFAENTSATRAASQIASGLGLFALILAAVGIYGVMAYSVIQRTREIGIRVALGAQGRDVLRMMIGQGLRLVGVGVILGVSGGAAVSRALSSLLFGLSPFDPIAYAGVSLFLVMIAFAAIYLPARRATEVDPINVLRFE